MNQHQTPDVFYYNVVINNPGPNSIPANYSEQRDIPLIKNPSEYYLSIIRFSVPGFSIPILITPTTNFPSTPATTPYELALSYNGTTVKQTVTYYSRSFSEDPNLTQTSQYYFIYTYQHLLDLINNAFSTALANLIIATGEESSPIASADAPYLIFNAQTQLISLICSIQYYQTPSSAYNTTNPTPPDNIINIFINPQLYNFFQGMNFIYNSSFATNYEVFWLLVENTGANLYPNNTGMFLSQTQQFNTLNNWNSFNSLAFISKSLPILKEFTPNIGFQNSIGYTQSSSNTLPIITDFIPLLQFAGDQRSDYIYNANSLYRLIELQDINALYSIDLQVVWIDQYNNQYPIILEPGQSINIKFMFIKKSVYKQNKFLNSF